MKTIRVYSITKEQVEKTEYRPLDVETEEIETEDDWNYADIIANEAEYEVEMVRDCRDLIVWRIHTPYSRYVEPETAEDDEDFEEYFTVELKD